MTEPHMADIAAIGQWVHTLQACQLTWIKEHRAELHGSLMNDLGRASAALGVEGFRRWAAVFSEPTTYTQGEGSATVEAARQWLDSLLLVPPVKMDHVLEVAMKKALAWFSNLDLLHVAAVEPTSPPQPANGPAIVAVGSTNMSMSMSQCSTR